MSGLFDMVFKGPPNTNNAEQRATRQEQRLNDLDTKQAAREKSLREDQDSRLRAIRAMQGGRPTLLQSSETGVGGAQGGTGMGGVVGQSPTLG
jgi:membrane protein involved in colicin uptake